jgi:hypothetical protein
MCLRHASAPSPEAASLSDLQGQPRSPVRREGEGCGRPLPPPARPCDRIERGREDLDPGARAHPTPAAPCGLVARDGTRTTTRGTASSTSTPRSRSPRGRSPTSSPSRTPRRTSSRSCGRWPARIRSRSSTSCSTTRRLTARQTSDRGLAENPRVHFHYTPTSASWLNQVEGFFGILGKQSLSENDFVSRKKLREHIAAYMRDWNKNPMPFAWTKPAAAIIQSHRRMLDRTSTAVH